MRTGACSVQQALTTEAASVLKLSLNLARRRGHPQVTPLHVAATLLTTSSSSNLLRKACLKSQPHHLASHPLQCRALELCFNVALNRLPTAPPPSSASLIHTQPSLSNALIAALKRAQAHQRRGCIEQQQQQHFQHQNQQQQQQPLLAIKVELEQLIISILDDPSVSRVMREAGFSSTTVKTNLEEDGSFSSSLSTSSFFFDSNREVITNASLFNTHFLKPSLDQYPGPHFSIREDLRVVLEVMCRKQGRRSNTVVVGDSVSIAEGVVNELTGRLDRGEVPDVLKSSHLIKLQLSYVHLRLMSKGEVDLKVFDLRRKVTSLNGGGVIVFVGDLRWALDDQETTTTRDGFRPVEHLIEEIGKLVSELKAVSSNKVWLMATASYQTYMRCQVRHPPLEAQWALQAVAVPSGSGGLKLSLQAAPCSGLDSRVTTLTQYPFQMLEPKAFYPMEEEDKLLCCAECTANFEREASVFRSEAKESNQLPYWLQPHKPQNHHEDTLLELRRKWNRLCRNLQHSLHSLVHVLPPYPASHPWWSTLLTDNKNKSFMDPHSLSFAESIPKFGNASPILASQVKNGDGPKSWLSDVKTTLALGNPMFSDTATSMDPRSGARVNQRELSRQLQENIPWQSETIPSIIEALIGCQSKNGIWVLVKGTDQIGKRRLARVAAESFFGSTDRLVYINCRRSAIGVEAIAEAMRRDPKCVVLIEDVDQASGEFIKTLSECIKTGFFKDPFGGEVELSHGVFILTTSSSTSLDSVDESHDRVLKMRLCVEDEKSNSDHKRKNSESDSSSNEKKKKLKSSEAEFELDLNICAENSDLTHEMDGYDEVQFPNGLLESIGTPITMDEIPGEAQRIEEGIITRLCSAVDGELIVDRAAVEGFAGATGWFLEGELERWVREVFELSVVTVKKGGKVRLEMEGKDGNVGECGFLGSVLPRRIHVLQLQWV